MTICKVVLISEIYMIVKLDSCKDDLRNPTARPKEAPETTDEPTANPPVWPGIEVRLKPLSSQEVALVEEAVLSLLETLGQVRPSRQ